jgi:hypothetical protein
LNTNHGCSAYADASFKQDWEPPITFSLRECDPARLFFPDLDGDGYGDWSCVGDVGDVLAFLQKPTDGKPVNNWAAQGTIATGKDGRNGDWVFFAEWGNSGLQCAGNSLTNSFPAWTAMASRITSTSKVGTSTPGSTKVRLPLEALGYGILSARSMSTMLEQLRKTYRWSTSMVSPQPTDL